MVGFWGRTSFKSIHPTCSNVNDITGEGDITFPWRVPWADKSNAYRSNIGTYSYPMEYPIYSRYPIIVDKYGSIKTFGVSYTRRTPKSSMLVGFSLTNHPFWVPHLWNFPLFFSAPGIVLTSSQQTVTTFVSDGWRPRAQGGTPSVMVLMIFQ